MAERLPSAKPELEEIPFGGSRPASGSERVHSSYLVYGLRIASDRPVPGLTEAYVPQADLFLSLTIEPDWLISANRLPAAQRLERRGSNEHDDPTFVLTTLGQEEFFRLEYSDGACFVLDRNATRLWGSFLPPLTIEDLSTYLLGPVLGFVLRRRGVMALHASCVAAGDHAVVLAGPSEAGKSTTAGALALQGERILCEDIVPLIEKNAQYFVEPGYPRVCLWPDSVQKLLGASDALPLLTPNWEKRYLPLENGRGKFCGERLPLGAIFIFGARVADGNAPRIEPLSRREALLELVQNTYMNFLLDRTQRAAEFEALTQLVGRVPIQRIVPHADAERLPAMCDLLLENAQHLLGTAQPVSEILRA